MVCDDLIQTVRRASDPQTWRSFDAASPDVRRKSAGFVLAFRSRLERLLCLVSSRRWTIFINIYTVNQQGLWDFHQGWEVHPSWIDEFAPASFDMRAMGLFRVQGGLEDSMPRNNAQMAGPTADIISFFSPRVRRAWDINRRVGVRLYAGGVQLADYESPSFSLSAGSTALAPLANDVFVPTRGRFICRLRQLVDFVSQDPADIFGDLVAARYGDIFVIRDARDGIREYLPKTLYYVRGSQAHTGSVEECVALCMSFYDEEDSEPSLHLRGQGWHWMPDTEEIARFFPPDYDLTGVFKLLQ